MKVEDNGHLKQGRNISPVQDEEMVGGVDHAKEVGKVEHPGDLELVRDRPDYEKDAPDYCYLAK